LSAGRHSHLTLREADARQPSTTALASLALKDLRAALNDGPFLIATSGENDMTNPA
jgi:hypothetical protein